jgi:DNA-binding IclR family transcriptional regulator
MERDGRRKTSTRSVQSVDRAFDILLQFVNAPSIDAARLQSAVKLKRATLYRLLATMERKRILRSYGEPRRYELGASMIEIVNAWLSQLDVTRVSSEFLRDLWERSGETIVLSILQEDDTRMTVQQFRSNSPLSYAPGIGKAIPLYAGASSKAMLAFLPPERRKRILRGAPRRLKRAPLIAELAVIEQRGFAISRGELVAGAASIAAPIFDRDDAVVGSIALALPELRLSRLSTKPLIEDVCATARQISRRLGSQS